MSICAGYDDRTPTPTQPILTPHKGLGYNTLDRMLSVVSRHGGQIGCCGTCMDAPGITQTMLVQGATRSTMDELTDWTLAADRVLVF